MKSKNPIEEFQKAKLEDQNLVFLHSGKSGKSILAKNPIAKFQGKLKDLENFTKKHKNQLIVGYISYDTSYELYDIKQTAVDDLKLPKLYFLAFDKWQEFKTDKEQKFGLKKLPRTNIKAENFKAKITAKEYKLAYNKIKYYLKEGDIYQINLTHRLEGKSNLHPRELFQNIIKDNRVDFLTYIEGDGFEILSASPERFIKINKDQIETCPIKGTRPRGKNKKEDEKLQKDLIEDVKEAAELNMITDLLRNDLGKVCQIGTVKVEGHRLLKKCEKVWHTYSKVTGKLSKKISAIKALISMLPGGSITGCPKKRAIEIIDELEPKTRGVYTGVIGYIDPKGILDFNIAIRTVIKKQEKLYLQVGGGIVIDSKEKNEYQETLDKAKSFMNIIKE